MDGWTAAGGGPAVHVRAVLLLIWRYKADADDAVPTTRCRDAAAIVRKKRSLQPKAVEQMQLRGRRRIDGVGRPEFDFYTGLRGTGLRGTLIRALASAARRRRPALRARSSCAPRVVVWPRVSAYILTPGSHPTALRRASVTERALHFTAAVQAVGASERDGAGAAGVAGRVHGFGATGGDTDLYGRLRVSIVGR